MPIQTLQRPPAAEAAQEQSKIVWKIDQDELKHMFELKKKEATCRPGNLAGIYELQITNLVRVVEAALSFCSGPVEISEVVFLIPPGGEKVDLYLQNADRPTGTLTLRVHLCLHFVALVRAKLSLFAFPLELEAICKGIRKARRVLPSYTLALSGDLQSKAIEKRIVEVAGLYKRWLKRIGLAVRKIPPHHYVVLLMYYVIIVGGKASGSSCSREVLARILVRALPRVFPSEAAVEDELDAAVEGEGAALSRRMGEHRTSEEPHYVGLLLPGRTLAKRLIEKATA